MAKFERAIFFFLSLKCVTAVGVRHGFRERPARSKISAHKRLTRDLIG
jgi:hypothetical protein